MPINGRWRNKHGADHSADRRLPFPPRALGTPGHPGHAKIGRAHDHARCEPRGNTPAQPAMNSSQPCLPACLPHTAPRCLAWKSTAASGQASTSTGALYTRCLCSYYINRSWPQALPEASVVLPRLEQAHDLRRLTLVSSPTYYEYYYFMYYSSTAVVPLYVSALRRNRNA